MTTILFLTNLVSVHPKSVILGQMTNLNMVFHIVVSVYRLVKILKLGPVPWWISERLISYLAPRLIISARAEVRHVIATKFQPSWPGWNFSPGWNSPCNQALRDQCMMSLMVFLWSFKDMYHVQHLRISVFKKSFPFMLTEINLMMHLSHEVISTTLHL